MGGGERSKKETDMGNEGKKEEGKVKRRMLK